MTLDLEVLADRLSLSQQCAQVALGGVMVWSGRRPGFLVGQGDLSGISNLNDSMIDTETEQGTAEHG